jgi:glyoxylase-like metal-dependent hydrolase (beta-lactamase superfamily II)
LTYTVAQKVRHSDRSVELRFANCSLFAGRPALIIDDIVSSGGTLIACAKSLSAADATTIDAVVTHALFPPELMVAFTGAGIHSIWSTHSRTPPILLFSMISSLRPSVASSAIPSYSRSFHERHHPILGAARTITGSCYRFKTPAGSFLIDCGLFQRQRILKELNYTAFPFHPADIDVVLLTHAHIDHSGLLPKLVREGFRGRILATRGTIALCSYMLPDSGSIQESEVFALNLRNVKRGKSEVSPIYTQADALASLQAFQLVEYEAWIDVIPAVRARYWNAGHLLGSASIELEFAGERTSSQLLRLLASGDVGPDAKLLHPTLWPRQDSTTSFRKRLMAIVFAQTRHHAVGNNA